MSDISKILKEAADYKVKVSCKECINEQLICMKDLATWNCEPCLKYITEKNNTAYVCCNKEAIDRTFRMLEDVHSNGSRDIYCKIEDVYNALSELKKACDDLCYEYQKDDNENGDKR
jgi:ribosomal protein S27E